jgi:glucose 1-dehydrogenase
MFDEMFAKWGTIDILVNNAGLQQDAAFVDMTLAQWNKVISINLTGMFLCAQRAVKEFIRRGPVEGSPSIGKVINMSSVHEIIPWAGHVNYASSKGAVRMFTQSLSQELAPQKIRINAIGPGAIATPINRPAWETPEALESLLRLIPYKRVGQAIDIGKAAVWLASDESDYVNGQTLFVDGGMTLFPEFADGG